MTTRLVTSFGPLKPDLVCLECGKGLNVTFGDDGSIYILCVDPACVGGWDCHVTCAEGMAPAVPAVQPEPEPTPQQPEPEAKGDDLVRQLASYHIARAFGLWQTAENMSSPNHAAACEHFASEYELALTWQSLASGDPSAPWAIATFVKAMTSSPEDPAKPLRWLLKWADLDPARILPYMPDGETAEPEPDILSAISYDALTDVRMAALHSAVNMSSPDEGDAAVLARAGRYASWVLEPIAADLDLTERPPAAWQAATEHPGFWAWLDTNATEHAKRAKRAANAGDSVLANTFEVLASHARYIYTRLDQQRTQR